MIKFHRNLNNGMWSVTRPKSKVVHVKSAILTNVTIKQPSGKSFEQCLGGSARSVFAWFKCETVTPQERTVTLPEASERIYFNPRRGDRWFHVIRDGQQVKIDKFSAVYALPDGIIYGLI